jgi:enoyl-CoA hydratase/carnithine racemase
MKTLIVRRADRVVTVTMNRPEKKNALDHTMFCELLEVFSGVTESDDDRVLVLI